MHVHCTITMDEVEGAGHRIVASDDRGARRRCPDADAAAFAAGRRRPPTQGCPFSALIRASATVTVDATLGRRQLMAPIAPRTSPGRARSWRAPGRSTSVESGAFGPLDVTWASRTEESEGRTSPEELIAAAHAACFSMALSHGLAQGGTPPERLETSTRP